MSRLSLLALALCLTAASARVLVTPTGAASLTTKSPSRRDEAVAIPTFTFGPKDVYFPAAATHPEPRGTEIQVYPTGVYEAWPSDGITIAFGPELRGQVETVRAQSCNNKPVEECQNALNAVLQSTDVSTHIKRFDPGTLLLVAWGVGALIGFAIAIYKHDLGKEMRFRPEDLRQIHSIAAAQEIAIVTASDGGAALATLTYQPPATTTLTSFISIETLTTASGGHEAGDFVYHIPKTTAERIEDFLGMTGLQETQQICQGQSFKRADPTEECIERILHHAMSLVDTGPDDLMALAQANVPIEPAAGQAIGFPIPNIYIGESVAFVRMYRQMNSATATTPQADQNWDPSLLARSALGLTIAAHAVMFTGQALMELFVGKDDVIKDFKEEDLACPKDLICTSVNCQGQKEVINPLTGETISKPPSTPTCLTVKNLGCRCGIVNYPYVWEVPQGYMDAQYEWLEELIKRADEPVLEAECKSDLQRFDEGTLGPPNPGSSQTFNPRSSFEGWIETACTEFDNRLDKEWHWTYSDVTGFDFSFRWSQIPDGVTNCPFDCNAAFAPFLDSSDCVKDEGFSSSGKIVTECGRASLYTRTKACTSEHPECCPSDNGFISSDCGEVDE